MSTPTCGELSCDECSARTAELTAERDQLRAEVERLGHLEALLRSSAADMTAGSITAGGVADLRAALAAATEECTDVRLKWHAVMGTCAAKEDAIIESDEELARLRAEVERLGADRDCEKRLRKDADEFRENAIERATKAEGDLVALEQCHDDNCRGVVRIADDLTAATAEVARLKRDYEYDHKCLHEVRERCESWKQRAERAEAELATAKERLRTEAMDDYAAIKDLQRELATERARLDWVFRNCKVIADGYAIHDREDLGVAMKEDAK